MSDNGADQLFKICDSSSFVKIRYQVKVENGPILKGAENPEIMDFVTGFRQVIPGLEKRLLGHVAGEALSFTVPADEAFGERRDDFVIIKDKKQFHFPEGFYPYPGMEISVVTNMEDGPDTVIIKEVRDNDIIIDFNHPLAGCSLKYTLEIIEARPSKASDVCSEWETEKSEGCSSCAPHEVVLGDDTERRYDN